MQVTQVQIVSVKISSDSCKITEHCNLQRAYELQQKYEHILQWNTHFTNHHPDLYPQTDHAPGWNIINFNLISQMFF